MVLQVGSLRLQRLLFFFVPPVTASMAMALRSEALWVGAVSSRFQTQGACMQDPAGLYVMMQAWFERQALIRTVGFGEREVETIALDWLAKAGKRWRPFLTACIYQALRPQDDAELIRFLSVAVECIHKGSLIYDDIQDGDEQRYGEPTVHAIHGMPLALTASLLLIGHGYRMIGEAPFAKEKCNAMLQCATKGHCDLCLGQGSELAWMRAPKPLSPSEVLEIFLSLIHI